MKKNLQQKKELISNVEKTLQTILPENLIKKNETKYNYDFYPHVSRKMNNIDDYLNEPIYEKVDDEIQNNIIINEEQSLTKKNNKYICSKCNIEIKLKINMRLHLKNCKEINESKENKNE